MKRFQPNLCFVAVFFLLLGAVATSRAGELRLDANAIVDAGGRRIHVTKPFKRIISLYGAHTENLFALGAAPRLIGVSPSEDWPPEARSKPVYSYHDGLEKFLAARPDLVLIRPMIDRGYTQLIRRLEGRGVTVVSLQPGTVDQMFVYWRILGRLSGREAAAEAMVARFKQTVQRIRRRTASIAHKKRVYFEAIHQRMRTFSPESMPIFVLETAGGINVAADAHPRRGTNIADFGKERILSRADAIDVYLAQVGPMNHPTPAMIRSEPGYGLIRAVRQNQIYLIDETEVSRPTLRMLAGICRVVQILYPQIWAAEADAMGCSSATGTGRPALGAKMQKETKP
jgi:iron complex transport system substrate-binding protein